MRQEHLEIARLLYKPTKKIEELVLKLCELFDTPLPNGVQLRSLSFKNDAISIGGLKVKQVIRTETHCGIEIHWYPNREISTTQDPFCSAFILRYNSLNKLYREIEKAISKLK